MSELIQQVMQQADISEESASRAVDAVLNFLRDRLPSPVAAQVESYLGGESGVSGESVIARVKPMMGAFKKE